MDGEQVRLDAVCDGLRESIVALTDVIVSEGTDAAVVALEALTVKYEAGCT